MSDVMTRPLSNALYAQDFALWCDEQVRLLTERRFDELDLENLIDEVASVGRSEKREIRGRLSTLVLHLLKWQYQPALRSVPWRVTIDEQRDQLAEMLDDSPSLRSVLRSALPKAHRSGRSKAIAETGLAESVFPDEPPFTVEQAPDPKFLPDEAGGS